MTVIGKKLIESGKTPPSLLQREGGRGDGF